MSNALIDLLSQRPPNAVALAISETDQAPAGAIVMDTLKEWKGDVIASAVGSENSGDSEDPPRFYHVGWHVPGTNRPVVIVREKGDT